MRVFVTGVNGQLGYEVMNALKIQGHEGIGSGSCPTYSGIHDNSYAATAAYVPLDITDSKAVFSMIASIRPDAVIHCAAWTAVDAAEMNENSKLARRINRDGTENIAIVCRAIDAKMLYISTDYVFNGTGTSPWKADCQNFMPLNFYGQTKLEGEFAVSRTLRRFFIIRTEWMFGLNGNNFVNTILNLGNIHNEVQVVNDQIGTPTYAPDLARLLVDMAETEKYGYYHVTNEGGYISWYEFTKEIYKQVGLQTKVAPITTSDYKYTRARRPLNSRLDKSKLIKNGFSPLPDWKNAICRYLKEIENIEGRSQS